jgi:predicted RNase H-like HicB family nuclease
MKSVTYHVEADWDAEAAVWVATSEDVPGLATEAGTIESLTDKLKVMIPELLEANGTSLRHPESA